MFKKRAVNVPDVIRNFSETAVYTDADDYRFYLSAFKACDGLGENTADFLSESKYIVYPFYLRFDIGKLFDRL